MQKAPFPLNATNGKGASPYRGGKNNYFSSAKYLMVRTIWLV